MKQRPGSVKKINKVNKALTKLTERLKEGAN